MSVHAAVSFRGDDARAVGRERIKLLEAIAREGSISAAARAAGLTYKAAWDAIDAMNNLFGRPLVEARTGGRKGGGAALTPAGQRVVEAFSRLEGELARVMRDLGPELGESGISASNLMWGFLMRTSARNALRGVVTEIREDAVNAEVVLAISEGVLLHSVITCESVRGLGLFPGREIVALIKAPFVLLAPPDEARRTSVANRLEGIVVRHETGGVNTEVTLDIGDGKTLTAVITTRSAEALGLRAGDRACALVDAAHIILAID